MPSLCKTLMYIYSLNLCIKSSHLIYAVDTAGHLQSLRLPSPLLNKTAICFKNPFLSFVPYVYEEVILPLTLGMGLIDIRIIFIQTGSD